MAKQERMKPSQSGRRYFSFCASFAQCSRVCMLPSSGAWALRANGPNPDLAASADTAAMATWPSPIPPYSFGICGIARTEENPEIPQAANSAFLVDLPADGWAMVRDVATMAGHHNHAEI